MGFTGFYLVLLGRRTDLFPSIFISIFIFFPFLFFLSPSFFFLFFFLTKDKNWKPTSSRSMARGAGGNPRVTEFYWVFLRFMGLTWFYLVFHNETHFEPCLLRIIELVMILPSFTGFLLGFTEFRWVLLGFTGFYWFFTEYY